MLPFSISAERCSGAAILDQRLQILACALIGYTGDVSRFTNRDQFASYAGVAPVEHSSGGRTFHRLSRRGNR